MYTDTGQIRVCKSKLPWIALFYQRLGNRGWWWSWKNSGPSSTLQPGFYFYAQLSGSDRCRVKAILSEVFTACSWRWVFAGTFPFISSPLHL